MEKSAAQCVGGRALVDRKSSRMKLNGGGGAGGEKSAANEVGGGWALGGAERLELETKDGQTWRDPMLSAVCILAAIKDASDSARGGGVRNLTRPHEMKPT